MWIVKLSVYCRDSLRKLFIIIFHQITQRTFTCSEQRNVLNKRSKNLQLAELVPMIVKNCLHCNRAFQRPIQKPHVCHSRTLRILSRVKSHSAFSGARTRMQVSRSRVSRALAARSLENTTRRGRRAIGTLEIASATLSLARAEKLLHFSRGGVGDFTTRFRFAAERRKRGDVCAQQRRRWEKSRDLGFQVEFQG